MPLGDRFSPWIDRTFVPATSRPSFARDVEVHGRGQAVGPFATALVALEFQVGLGGALDRATSTPLRSATNPSWYCIARSSPVSDAGAATLKGMRTYASAEWLSIWAWMSVPITALIRAGRLEADARGAGRPRRVAEAGLVQAEPSELSVGRNVAVGRRPMSVARSMMP